jgi:hypothetical protein
MILLWPYRRALEMVGDIVAVTGKAMGNIVVRIA